MYIKAQTIIPAGINVTRVAPSKGKAKSIYTLLRAENRKLEQQEALKNRAHRFTAALKVGYTVVEALKPTEE